MAQQEVSGLHITIKLKGYKSSEVDSETPKKQEPEKKVKEPSNGA
jgi:hypothetical protein